MGRPPGRKNTPKQQTNGATEIPLRPAAQKKAAAAAAVPKPDAPAKKNGPSSSQNAEWLAEFTRLKTASRSVAGDIAALGARVKSGGGDWKNLKKVHDLLKLDPDEAKAELEGLVALAAQNEIRVSWVGNQAALTDVLEQNSPPAKNTTGSRDLAAARAHTDGFNSGRNGAVPSDNPFRNAPGSEEYVAWHNGRDEGQQAREDKKPAETKRLKDAIAADSTLPDETAPTAEEPIF